MVDYSESNLDSKGTYLWFPYCLNQLGIIQVKDLDKYLSFIKCFILTIVLKQVQATL